MSERVMLLEGDVLEALKLMPDNSVDAVLSDPPYGLEFMGKAWDAPWKENADGFRRSENAADVGRDNVFGRTSGRSPEYKAGVGFQLWCEQWAKELLRVLRPGGHAVLFGSTRTYHRLVVALEDAGFECRDTISYMYGCLTEDTEILVDGEWKHYLEATTGRLTLCYNRDTDAFSWQSIHQLFVYNYDDTAYRIQSNSTDQIVTRNHRCLIEQDGAYVFQFAEEAARQHEIRVPVLESVQNLLASLPMPNKGADCQKQDVRTSMCNRINQRTENAKTDVREDRNGGTGLPMRCQVLPRSLMGEEGRDAALLREMQRIRTRKGVGKTRIQRSCSMDGSQQGEFSSENVWSTQPCVEGRSYIQTIEGQLLRREVCSMSAEVSYDGTQERIHHGASPSGRQSDWSNADSSRVGASRQSQTMGQSTEKSHAFPYERRAQTVRASRFARADLARLEPFHLKGIVWCVNVPTGAFVARRNGKVFVTGNSGMPKSLNVSIAIDDKLGAKRPVIGQRVLTGNAAMSTKEKGGTYGVQVGTVPAKTVDVTGPATPQAALYDGWGTNLKPSWEPAALVRKPLDGTVANTAMVHGTGGINVDGGRIGFASDADERETKTKNAHGDFGSGTLARVTLGVDARARGDGGNYEAPGRWPANVVLSHLSECTVVGTRTLAGDPRGDCNGTRPGGFGDIGAANGDGEPNAHVYGDEVVKTWNCAPGCPVAMLDAQSGERPGMTGGGVHRDGYRGRMEYGGQEMMVLGFDSTTTARGDTGGASRFFYCSKASRAEREFGCENLPTRSGAEAVDREEGSVGVQNPRAGAGRSAAKVHNHHPTLKPISLTRWLATLLLPPVLDRPRRIVVPFSGAGSEMIGCLRAGWDEVVGIERDPDYIPIARARIDRWGQAPVHMDEAEVVGEARSEKKKVDVRQVSLFDAPPPPTTLVAAPPPPPPPAPTIVVTPPATAPTVTAGIGAEMPFSELSQKLAEKGYPCTLQEIASWEPEKRARAVKWVRGT